MCGSDFNTNLIIKIMMEKHGLNKHFGIVSAQFSLFFGLIHTTYIYTIFYKN